MIYEFGAESVLHVFIGEPDCFGFGGEAEHHALGISGSFVMDIRQDNDGVSGPIRDVMFRTTSEPEFVLTGRGRYGQSNQGFQSLHFASMNFVLTVNGEKEVTFSHEIIGANTAEFPRIQTFLFTFPPLGETECFRMAVDVVPHGDEILRFFRRGDVDGNGVQNISDVVSLLLYLFRRTQEPTCLDGADANDDGALSVNDAVFLLGYLFRGGSRPPLPQVLCGLDTTDDDLDCRGQSACMP